MNQTSTTASSLLAEFNSWLGVAFKAPADLLAAAQAAIDGCADSRIYPEDERRRRLIALINAKLKLNKDRLQAFLDAAAVGRVFPNYHDKIEFLNASTIAMRSGSSGGLPRPNTRRACSTRSIR